MADYSDAILSQVLTLTGESDEDLLTVLIEMATERVLSLTNRTTLVSGLKPAVTQWTIVAYNRIGMEGETSRSGEGGITSAFAEIPLDIQRMISQYRLARVCGKTYEAEEESDDD